MTQASWARSPGSPGRPHSAGGAARWRLLPAATAGVALALVGAAGIAVLLDRPTDGTYVEFGRSSWRANGVVVGLAGPSALRPGDVVVAVDGRPLSGVGVDPAAPYPEGRAVRYDVLRAGVPTVVDVRLERPSPAAVLPAPPAGNLLWTLLLGLLAVYVAVRRPGAGAAPPLLVCAGGSCGAVLAAQAGMPAIDVAAGGPMIWLYHAGMMGSMSVAWGGMVALALVPLRRVWPRPRVLAAAAYAGPLVVVAVWSAVALVLGPGGPASVGLAHLGESLVSVASFLVAAALAVVAARRRAEPEIGLWLRWIAGGGAVSAALAVAGWLGPEAVVGHQLLPPPLMGLAGLPFVTGVAVAIVRHRLFGIQRLLSRSVVYAALLAVLAGLCAAGVAAAAVLSHPAGAVGSGIAVGVATLAVQPAWRAGRRRARRLLFGDRGDPGAALARLGRRLAAAPLPDRVLPGIVEVVSGTLRLPYVAVELADGTGGFRPAERRGSPVGELVAEPLTSRGQRVGRLVVSAREPDEPLAPSDMVVLGHLSRQIGSAVHAVLLHDDLLRSREEERMRLRRDLHDGLGPALLGAALKADAIRVLVDGEAGPVASGRGRAVRLLREVTMTLREAAGDLRRLVDGLRPPDLDRLGLTGALEARARAFAGDLVISVRGPAREVPLPAPAEVAAYHIAVEAMANAVRHACALRCDVRITVGEVLLVEVTDDGRGISGAPVVGVGLRSMRERAREAGGECRVLSLPDGGTSVEAVLPIGSG